MHPETGSSHLGSDEPINRLIRNQSQDYSITVIDRHYLMQPVHIEHSLIKNSVQERCYCIEKGQPQYNKKRKLEPLFKG